MGSDGLDKITEHEIETEYEKKITHDGFSLSGFRHQSTNHKFYTSKSGSWMRKFNEYKTNKETKSNNKNNSDKIFQIEWPVSQQVK